MKSYIFSLLAFALIFGFLISGADVISGKADSEGASILEDAIRRASVQCYAIEGCYPESVDYLVENYGITIDPDKYNVFYEGFASNIMPDITVIQKEAE